ncbi:MAG: M20/M25/M40 family metallo-hydrolase [Eubacteriales bacterium]|nr:M20/M25/M40 family metallo-hydrolase [Eubacteriales bacterium]MDD4583173.1 M20/M25/M40 family metallo-hydrolase [Eubacteriales bacterium]
MKDKMKDRIDRFIEVKKDQIINDIFDLIRFESIHGRVRENQSCLKHFLQRASDMGFKTMVTKAFDAGVVEMGQGEEILGILVHLDVVDIGDPDKWETDPFEGVLRDGFLWGRGTVDDKGAAVMSLYAMKAVERLGLPFQRKVWLIVGTAEEGEWTDIENFKNEFPLPDFGFSPDGEFPIYNIENGYADIELHFYKDKEGISKLKGGLSPNTIPSKAEIRLEDGRSFIYHGISAHSSTPENGDNAIIKLCKNLSREVEFDFVRFVNHCLGQDYYVGKLAIDDGRDSFNGEYVGRTTVVPTVISSDYEGVKLIVNIRQKYGTSKQDIMNAFANIAEEYSYKAILKDYLEPMRVSRNLPFLKIMNQVYERYGLKGGFQVAAGTSYAKALKNFVSWGPVFLTDPSCAHMENERLSVNTMILAAKLYAMFIGQMTLKEQREDYKNGL